MTYNEFDYIKCYFEILFRLSLFICNQVHQDAHTSDLIVWLKKRLRSFPIKVYSYYVNETHD